MKIALCQIPASGNPFDDLTKYLSCIRAASAGGADLAVLPDLRLSRLQVTGETGEPRPMRIHGMEMSKIRRTCVACGITAAVPVLIEGKGRVCAVICADGGLAGLSSPDGTDIAETPFGKTAVATDATGIGKAEDSGAGLVIVPASPDMGDILLPDSGIPVMICRPASVGRRSVLRRPDGTCLEAEDDGESMVFAELRSFLRRGNRAQHHQYDGDGGDDA